MSKKNSKQRSEAKNPPKPGQDRHLRISDLSRLVGMSPTMLRSWEKLGLGQPQRTESHYRLYSNQDVRLFKRVKFLRRERGLNAAAIVEKLKQEGLVHEPTNAKGVGNRLRNQRRNRGLSLAEVAKHADISVGFLSALERNQMNASVGTLRRLAKFYNINILDFFDASPSNPNLVRPRDRKLLEATPGVRMELLAWGNTVMEPHLFRVAPGAGSGESYAHEGEEFIYVMQGKLNISLNGEPHELKTGDSFYFDSATPHRWKNPGNKETLLLWVNTPPTF